MTGAFEKTFVLTYKILPEDIDKAHRLFAFSNDIGIACWLPEMTHDEYTAFVKAAAKYSVQAREPRSKAKQR